MSTTSVSISDPMFRGSMIVFGVVVGGTLFAALLRLACFKYEEYRTDQLNRYTAQNITRVFTDNPIHN